MAQEILTKAKRRWLHLISGDLHPNCVARATRGLKQGTRRHIRRSEKQKLRSPEITDQ